MYEVVIYDPEDIDTYPSVCTDPDEVRDRFGFAGGETLLFDEHGCFVGPATETGEPAYDFRTPRDA